MLLRLFNSGDIFADKFISATPKLMFDDYLCVDGHVFLLMQNNMQMKY